jgi:two-component system, response regulator PhcR
MTPKNRHAKSILFVDDETMSTKWFEKAFGKDYNIYCANSTDSALTMMQLYGDDIAIVMTDFRMPESNGLDLLKAVNQTHPWIVKILVSAYADKDLVLQAINQQLVFRVLEKPWEDHIVRRTLREALIAFQQDLMRRDHIENSISGMRDSLAFMSTELGAPLTVISSCLGMIQSALSEVNTSEPMPKRLREALPALQSAQRNILNSQNLMSSFTQSTRTAFSSTESNPIQAARLVQLLLTELSLSDEQKELIKTNIKADFSISTKQNLVYLCLASVLQNALQAVQSGTQPPSIDIRIAGNPAPTALIGHTIRITDNGPGIAPDVLEHLFASHAPAEKQALATEGSMGLRFCRKVMRSFGGDVTVSSNQAGTSVTLQFPATPKEST